MENRILFDIWGKKNHPGFFNPASVHTEAARFVIGSVPLHAIGLAFGDGLTNGFQLPKILAFWAVEFCFQAHRFVWWGNPTSANHIASLEDFSVLRFETHPHGSPQQVYLFQTSIPSSTGALKLRLRQEIAISTAVHFRELLGKKQGILYEDHQAEPANPPFLGWVDTKHSNFLWVMHIGNPT